jgi:hypothetical protein
LPSACRRRRIEALGTPAFDPERLFGEEIGCKKMMALPLAVPKINQPFGMQS